jgi:hypothetical protein
MLDLKIPLQPKQAELYDIYENSPCTRIGAGGSRGGAKSHAARSIMLLRRLKYPRTRGMIFRRKRKDLWDNHIQPYFAQWPILQSWYTKQENEIRLPNGSAICFRYAEYEKDVDDFLGPDFMDIMIDEATQVSEITIQKFFGCNRWPALPGVRAKMLLTTNPGGPGHDYLKRVMIDRKYEGNERPEDWHFIPFRARDNCSWALQALAADGLSEEDYYSWSDERRKEYFLTRTDYGHQLDNLPQSLRTGWLLGDWNLFAGQYFEWNRELTEISYDDFQRLRGLQPYQNIYLSIDWGARHHAYASWHMPFRMELEEPPLVIPELDQTRAGRRAVIQAEYQRSGQDNGPQTKDVIVTFREFLTTGLGEEALAEEIVRRTPPNERQRVSQIWLSPETGFESQLDRGWRIGDVFVRHGMPRAVAAFNKRIDGWRYLADKLRTVIRAKPFGHLQEYPLWCVVRPQGADIGCASALGAIPWAVADADRDGDIMQEPRDAPQLDVLDGLRYGVASYARSEDKPVAMRKQEFVSQFPVTGTARHTAGIRFDIEEKQRSTPVQLGGMHNNPRQRKHWR